MSNVINMSFRVDRDLKKQADELFKNLGMNTSVALIIPTMEVLNKKLISALK